MLVDVCGGADDVPQTPPKCVCVCGGELCGDRWGHPASL